MVKKTKWFPANVKPVRVGWYQVKCDMGFTCGGMHFWNGKYWQVPLWGECSAVPWRGIKK
jgi:hypothetical protein